MNPSPLANALRFESEAEVRRLLKQGEDPNQSGEFHISAEDFEAKVEALLEFGWDINRCHLLHDAKHGLGKRVMFYLAKGADPNTTDGSGQNALHKFAALGIGKEAIGALVEAGTNLSAADNEGHTPVDLAKLAPRKVALETLQALRQ